MENVSNKNSAAHIKASAKYNAKTYKRATLSIKLNEFEKIQTEVKKQSPFISRLRRLFYK